MYKTNLLAFASLAINKIGQGIEVQQGGQPGIHALTLAESKVSTMHDALLSSDELASHCVDPP